MRIFLSYTLLEVYFEIFKSILDTLDILREELQEYLKIVFKIFKCFNKKSKENLNP
jgi:hypothetical protein